MKKGDHLFLVDGSGYIFRAYHALPSLTRKSDGLPVGAVSGFCNMLWKLVSSARDENDGVTPTHFAVIFDHSSKTFRNELYPEYKANRDAPPEDLRPQFGLIRQATKAFNLPCIDKEGFEADDIIATYARHVREAGADCTIISSDKDLMQLVGDQVSMLDTMKNKHIQVPEVIEKWGVPPEQMIDLQALAGDSVDNVPGVPGIGPKTAAQLLEQFGNLDTLLERAGEIKQNKRRENLIEFADNARISRELVRLRDDVELDVDLDGLFLEQPNGPMLISYLKAMEMTTLTKRVAADTGSDADTIEPAELVIEWENARGPDLDPEDSDAEDGPNDGSSAAKYTPRKLVNARAERVAQSNIDHSTYETIRDIETLDRWCADIRAKGTFAFDTETTSLDAMQAELVGFSIAYFEGKDSDLKVKAAYVPLTHKTGVDDLLGGGLDENQINFDQALARLKNVLEDASLLKIAQNLKYDMLVLKQLDIDVVSFDDTMLLSYVLDAGVGHGSSGGHGMDVLADRWLGHKPIPYKEVAGSGKSAITFDLVEIEKATAYAAEDADITLRLWYALKPRLVADGLVSVYERLERSLVKVLVDMESRGISVDRQILSRLSGELAQGAAGLEAEIYELAGENFNIGSPKQLGEILFGKMGVPGGAKTKTGQWSTSAQVLEDLAAEGHELPRKIVDWRQLTKLKSTYTDALPNHIHPVTKRVHTSYAMASTSTGRLSSNDPNLQNIPVRTAEGRKIRTAFVPEKGNTLISADYSQIELRVLAHVADLTTLKQAFADGLDIHAMTASEMFGVPIKDMPSEVRRRAKAINFGIIYGISAFGLANQLGIPRGEASDYIKMYFERFPGIKDYMENTKTLAKEQGFVETIFGRRINFPDVKSSNHQVRAFNERAAINAPIQGSAADIIRRAMVKMDQSLADAGLQAKMLLQVHDELIFETVEAETEPTIDLVKSVMETASMPALSMSVPLKVDARAAENWDEAH
ncbi:DNA polymerase I [Lentilitoribacter sp. Alg239-R112]|uniref:DNA polymerase I n=1 Tax=Lentilitoribacter sp. Alg239-R112 TaxID=2305987 RepID=UPI0013A6A9AD|nr:DNA polymerase I [Lentilitoribacter sp. Alg239-R112]